VVNLTGMLIVHIRTVPSRSHLYRYWLYDNNRLSRWIAPVFVEKNEWLCTKLGGFDWYVPAVCHLLTWYDWLIRHWPTDRLTVWLTWMNEQVNKSVHV
jgi:hypothetical protein